jgi:hypothetical protein
MTDGRRAGAELLRQQAVWCRRLGSPLYGHLLEGAAADCEVGGAAWDVLAGHERDPEASAVALRFMGAVHRLVLAGDAPLLARHYPSAGGTVDGDPWPAFAGVLAHQRPRLRELVTLPVQTNEVGRSATLLGGFLEVARATGLPLRLLEVGSSAGLNLRWDHYRYEDDRGGFGPVDAAVRFVNVFSGPSPSLAGSATVAERAGCDAAPIDPASAAGRLTLRAYLWPDQTERYARLDGALAVAARVPARIDRADAGTWLAAELAQPTPDVAAVVFHSIVMQYLGRAGAARVAAIIAAAGSAATASAPLAWLRLEPVRQPDGTVDYRLDLTNWPSGESRTLAISSPHGPPVRWIATVSSRSAP